MKKKISIFLLLFTLCSLLFTPFIQAQSPTPEASDEVKEKIKERLEENVDEDVDKVKSLVDDQTSQLVKRGFPGKLKNITTDTLLIEIADEVKQASFSEETVFVKSPGNNQLNPEDLAVGDFIIAMGFLNDTGVLESKRVVVTTEPKPAPARQLLWGKVKEIDNQTIVFNDHEITLASSKNLKIKGIEEPEIEDINLEDKIYVIVTLDEDGEIDKVNQVLVIPTKNGLTDETEPTETETASSTAKTTNPPDEE
ncbi:hypothetical protein KKD62_02215 [Patescibacteria group bacterium]|nr:hypothetical protein [Patescibacteria group bacterium]MBU1931684.1 hypothetical protein [Patescibacteria group bacterium]